MKRLIYEINCSRDPTIFHCCGHSHPTRDFLDAQTNLVPYKRQGRMRRFEVEAQ